MQPTLLLATRCCGRSPPMTAPLAAGRGSHSSTAAAAAMERAEGAIRGAHGWAGAEAWRAALARDIERGGLPRRGHCPRCGTAGAARAGNRSTRPSRSRHTSLVRQARTRGHPRCLGSLPTLVQPQDPTHCLDGQPMELQACVNGRYVLRSGNCGKAVFATNGLWRLIKTTLPAPEPASWHAR